MARKIPFDVDKNGWHPSVLPGQIVLISTVDEHAEPNIAPKSWVSMAAFSGPVLLFGCNTQHTTYRNALGTGCFVVNVADKPLAPRIWSLLNAHGSARLSRCGFSLSVAQRVAAPLVDECPAHLECETIDTRSFGEEALVFGRIVAASIDPTCLEGGPGEQYARLQPIFFLEDQLFAPLGPVSSIDMNDAIADTV